MEGPPLLQSRVCQYENTPDAHLLADLIPGHENLWVLGGGSGHGYKLGAAMGEYLAKRLAGTADKDKCCLLIASKIHWMVMSGDKFDTTLLLFFNILEAKII